MIVIQNMITNTFSIRLTQVKCHQFIRDLCVFTRLINFDNKKKMKYEKKYRISVIIIATDSRRTSYQFLWSAIGCSYSLLEANQQCFLDVFFCSFSHCTDSYLGYIWRNKLHNSTKITKQKCFFFHSEN